jgi:hypothetical protein
VVSPVLEGDDAVWVGGVPPGWMSSTALAPLGNFWPPSLEQQKTAGDLSHVSDGSHTVRVLWATVRVK